MNPPLLKVVKDPQHALNPPLLKVVKDPQHALNTPLRSKRPPTCLESSAT